jgi:phosphoribosylamine--glycine ligase
MAGAGYPGEPKKGGVIRGLEEAGKISGVTIFQASTAKKGDDIIANGGRVLNVTATAPTLRQAVERAYEAIAKIDWPDGFCRRDIAWRALARD